MRLVTENPEETIEAGYRVGKALRKGQTVCLYGDLGSGKTVFVKGIARAMGIAEREITSASFIIISEHMGETGIPLYHIDLYRLEKGGIEETGIYDYIGRDGIAVIEWAERAADMGDCIRVKINFISEDKRELIIEGLDETDRK